MNNIIKKILKIIVCLIVSLLIIFLLLYLFVQTETFNRWALGFTLNKLNQNSQTTGISINVDSINGNILHGLILRNGSIVFKEDTMLSFSFIDLKYDLWGLPEHEIRLSNVIINSPVINFSKIKDLNDSIVWNFSKFFTPSPDTVESQSVSDWGIVIDNLKFQNGSMSVMGQLISEMPEWRKQEQKMKEFDINNAEVNELSFELSGRFFPEDKHISIRNMSFGSNSDFKVSNFNMTYTYDNADTVSEFQNLVLVTDKSRIKINKAKMSGFNPFDNSSFENLKNRDVDADIEITKFSFAELKFFLPSVDMLDSTAGLSFNASGKYGDLSINRLMLTLPNSEINLTGKLKNLDEPSKLFMDVHIMDTKIYLRDVKTIVNINSIPDYSHIGTIYPEIIYAGTYKKFFSKFDVNTNSGNFAGYVNMDLPDEKYSGKISAVNLNPGEIFKNKYLRGNLNFSADISGYGFNPDAVKANVNYQMNRTNIAGYDVSKSEGNINLNGRNVNLGLSLASSMGSLLVKGSIDLSDIRNPGYKLNGSLRNLNLSSVTKSIDDKSNLNFSFDINGRGIMPENLNGRFNFSVLPSQYSSIEIPSTVLALNIKNSGQENLINLVSDMADFNAEGVFGIDDVINAVRHNIAAAYEKFFLKLKLDSLQIPGPELTDSKDFDFNYSLSVKDPGKLNTLLVPFNLKFNGTSTGHLVNNPDGFRFSSALDIPYFAYKDTLVELINFTSGLFFSNNHLNISGKSSLDEFKFDMKTKSDKVMFDNSALDSVEVHFNIDNSVADVNLIVKDSMLSAGINGTFNLKSDTIVSSIGNFSVKYNRFTIENQGNWILNYIPDEKVKIQQMKLGNKNADINISGYYSLNSSSDISIDGNDMKLRDLIDIFYLIDTSRINNQNKYPVDGFLKQLSLNLKGTPADPGINLTAMSSELRYDGRAFGTVNINSEYKNENALLDIKLNNEDDNGSLTINGNLPFINPFSPDTAGKMLANNPVSINVKADNFQYRYFLKVIPDMPDLEGVVNGEISAEGFASSPELKGSINIDSGKFFFDLTGMNYNYEFSAGTGNSKMLIKNMKFYNADDKSRHIDIYGSIDLSGMRISDIDLMSSGDMVILDKDVEWNELGVYGNILAGIGQPAVSLKGNLDRLKISGQLIVNDATISSLPAGGKGYDIRKDNFNYILMNRNPDDANADTYKLIPENEYYKLDPFLKSKYKTESKKSITAGFLDIDVDISTVKNIYTSIDFGKVFFAKLFGELTAKLNMKTVNGDISTTGNVDVVGNSYFTFYKDFKLKDSRITFDGKLDDPGLNIQAVHTGTKVSEQYGNSTSTEVEVKLTVTGRASSPKLTLLLIENGTEITGPNAQADAVSYLLFGKFKSELNESERTSVAAAVGVTYISSYVMDKVRDIFPFLNQATFTVGDKPLNELKNFEFSIDYPLNNLLNLDIPETLMMEFFREELDDVFSRTQNTMNTGMKIIYKIKF